MKLQTKLISGFLLTALVPLCVLAALNYANLRASLTAEANDDLIANATTTAYWLDGFLTSYLERTRAEAQLPVFVDFLKLPADQRGWETEAYRRVLKNFNTLGRNKSIFVKSYALLDRDGRNVIDVEPVNVNRDESARDYFTVPMARQVPQASFRFDSNASSVGDSLFIGAVVTNAQQEPVGVLRVEYKGLILQREMLSNVQEESAGRVVVLLDEHHMRLADSGTAANVYTSVVPFALDEFEALRQAGRVPDRPIEDVSTDIWDCEDGLHGVTDQPLFTFHHSRDGSERIEYNAAGIALKVMPWVVVVATPEQLFLQPIEAQVRQAWIWAIVVGIIVVLVAILLSGRLAAPIVQLTSATERVAGGDLSARASVQSADEIGVLGQRFNVMADRVQETLSGLEKEVAERRRSEAAIKASEERFSTAFQANPDTMVITEIPSGILLEVNGAFEKTFGYSQAEAVGRSTLDLNLWADPADRADLVARLRENGSARNLEYRFRRKSGEEFDGAYSGEIIELGGGKCYLSILADITDSKRARENLRKSEERFRTVADFTYDWEYWVSPTREMVYVSPACERITGYTRDEFMADKDLLLKIVHEEDRDQVKDHMHANIGEAQLEQMVFRILTRDDRERWIEHVCQPVFNDAGEFAGYRASNRDITSRIESERETKMLQDQLHQAQRMEAVGQLAGGLSHDFNNLLTVIFGGAELLQLKLSKEDPELLESVDMILNAATQASGVTRSLLTFCRETRVQKGSINLGEFVTNSSRMLERVLPAMINMTIDAEADGNDWIEADEVQLNQILMNLIVNARDAMPDGGQLVISVERQSLESKDAWSSIEKRDSGCIVLSVTDTGVGMTPKVLASAFEPFFTTKTREQGTGLGLAVIHGIVKSHGGQIDIQSKEDEGTCVQIAFPACDKGRDDASQRTSLKDTLALGTTVLVADDNPQVLSVVVTALKAFGCEVVSAKDGVEAFEQFETHRGEIDLMILDVDMPRMRGTDCYDKIHALEPELPAILMSGLSEQDSTSASHDAAHFLMKPFQIPQFRNLVNQILEHKATA